MIADHVAKFIAAVSRQFNPPRLEPDEAAAWMRDYADEIGRWPEAVLARAAQIIRRTRTDRRFPLPAECAAACREADKELAADRRDSNLLSHGQRDQSPWASWRQDLADTLIKTPMGERAAHEGWVITLWNYCREHGRLPSEDMATAMSTAARGVPELISDLERKGDDLSQRCAQWGRSFIERRQQMAAFVFGDGDAVWRTKNDPEG